MRGFFAEEIQTNLKIVQVIFLLILVGVLVAGGFLGAFLWALNAGQFDDAVTPSIRVAQEDGNNDADPAPSHD